MGKHESVERALDWVAVAATVGTILEMLPSIAAVFTIVWTGIRIIETDTVRGLIKRIRGKREDDAREQGCEAKGD